MKITMVKGGVILDVNVKPKSKEFKIALEEDEIVVFCREEPVKGKVNREIIKEFSHIFGTKVELVSGFASKHKKLLVRNVDKNKIEHVMMQK